MNAEDLPTYSDLILPVLRAVQRLGGSAQSAEIVDQVLSDLDPSEEALAVTFPNRPHHSVLIDRIMWGRSYAKLIGALESPKRAVFLLTALGRELLALPEKEGTRRAKELDREFRRNRPQRKQSADDSDHEAAEVNGDSAYSGTGLDAADLLEGDDSPDRGNTWRDELLARLHALPPEGFEDFTMFLLRLYGLELERVGKSGDKGIDGIGFAPISPVMSSRVAVQVKKYDPNGKAVSRDEVSLFQNDAKKRGAEHAIFVTLGRYSKAAREEAVDGAPTVNLIDGDKLTELIREKELGVSLQPIVNPRWFDRFDTTQPGKTVSKARARTIGRP